MKIDMSGQQHLWVQLDPRESQGEVIIDKEHSDVRLCDGRTIVKVVFGRQSHLIESVLVDDIFVWNFGAKLK